MKSSNFNSHIGQLFNANLDIILQIFTASVGFLFALSPLIMGNPASHWYLPLIGIFLFTYSLTGIHVLKPWLSTLNSQHSETIDTKELDYVRPVMVTKFGEQNMANKQFFKTAA